MKIEDTLRLDCREKENRDFLLEKFKKIPFIKENLTDLKDMKQLKEVTIDLVTSLFFKFNTLTKHEHRYVTLAVYDKANTKPNGDMLIYTLYALDKKEMYIKLCVFCYYMRRSVENGKRRLHLRWIQRSCDMPVGVPFDICLYSLLLFMMSKMTNHEVGTVYGLFGDSHIYVTQIS